MRNSLTNEELITKLDRIFDNLPVKATDHCFGCGITKEYCTTTLFSHRIMKHRVLRYRPENYVIMCLSCKIDKNVSLPYERMQILHELIRTKKPPKRSLLITLLFQIENCKFLTLPLDGE